MVRRTGMAQEQALVDSVAQSVTTHYVAGTPVVTARLHTGRVLRCVGFMDGRSAAEEMRGWLLWLAMGVLCCACGGPEFKAGVLALQGDAEAPAEAAADVGGGAADSGAGDDGGGGEDAAPEAEAGQVDGCTRVTHSDGLGQSWQDCTPLGTYDAHEAMAACEAYSGAGTCTAGSCDGQTMVCLNDIAGTCTGPCWVLLGTHAGGVASSCASACPFVQTANWQ